VTFFNGVSVAAKQLFITRWEILIKEVGLSGLSGAGEGECSKEQRSGGLKPATKIESASAVAAA